MVYPYGCIRDSIGVIIVVKASVTVQVTLDGGSLANDIFDERAYGEGGGLAIYCSCWDALLGIRRTCTSFNCLVYPDFLAQALEGSMDHPWKRLGTCSDYYI